MTLRWVALAGSVAALAGCSAPPRPLALDLIADFKEAEIRSDSLDLPFLAADPVFERRGFGRLETSGPHYRAWSVRKEARLVLPFYSTGDKELRMRVRSHESLGSALPLAIALNDHPLSTVDLTPAEREFRLELPGALQRRGDNVLTFTAPRQRDPGPGEADRRTLVAAFSGLTIGPLGSEGPAQEPGLDASGLSLPPGSSIAYYLRLPEEARLGLETGKGTFADFQLAASLETDAGVEPLPPLNLQARSKAEVGLERRGGAIVRLELANPARSGPALLTSARITTPPLPSTAPPPSPLPSRPNVVIFLVDTLRADSLGAYGQAAPTSPRFDAFARESILFEDAWAQASWTRSAVASIFTGLYVGAHGVDFEDRVLSPALDRISDRFKAAGYRTGAFVGNHLLGGRFGFAKGFDSWNGGDDALYGSPASALVEKALAWVDSGSGPVFLYIHAIDPHSPYEPSPEDAAPFAVDFRGDHDTRALLRLGQLGQLKPDGLRFLVSRYQGEVRQADRGLGALLDGLRSRRMLDQSVALFTADHGEEFLDHGGTEHTKTLYQELIRVPLAVRLPGGLFAGTRSPAVVQQVDLLPTLLGLAGLSAPPDLPGRDLSTRWRTNPGAPSLSPLLFSEERFEVTNKYSVRADGWKLIFNNDGQALWRAGAHVELYDLTTDPGEKRNVADSFPVVRTFLLERLDAFRAHQARTPAAGAVTLTPEEKEQLKALGYVH